MPSTGLRLMEHLIHVIRGHKVMLDSDLATLYGVTTKALNQAVRRNIERFPEDFMFTLTRDKDAPMRSQFVTPSKRNIRYQSFAFTERGVAMLSSVLRSKRAIDRLAGEVRKMRETPLPAKHRIGFHLGEDA